MLQNVLEKFTNYLNRFNQIEKDEERITYTPEDLHATGMIETTIEEIDMYADDWVEQAANKANAVSGDTYVQLDHGILTVDQMNHFLNSMPMELTFVDSNNQFLYYNYHLEKGEMLADRHPNQVGSPLVHVHPDYAIDHATWVVQQLRAGDLDTYRINAPNEDSDKFVVHNYKGVKDEEGNFIGINEYVEDLEPIIEWYLEETGQQLVEREVDAVSGASENR